MTEPLLLAKDSTLSPPILSFLLGTVAGTVPSGLTDVDAFGKSAALQLMFAIVVADRKSLERQPAKQIDADFSERALKKTTNGLGVLHLYSDNFLVLFHQSGVKRKSGDATVNHEQTCFTSP